MTVSVHATHDRRSLYLLCHGHIVVALKLPRALCSTSRPAGKPAWLRGAAGALLIWF